MPCFHWPRISIHENMWNSKSCPEGLPHQKNGAIASRQAQDKNKARGIGFSSNSSEPCTDPLSAAKRISRRVAACRVFCGRHLGVHGRRGKPRLYRKVILLHPKILGKLTGPKPSLRGYRGRLAINDVEQTNRGLGRR